MTNGESTEYEILIRNINKISAYCNLEQTLISIN